MKEAWMWVVVFACIAAAIWLAQSRQECFESTCQRGVPTVVRTGGGWACRCMDAPR